MRDDATDDPVDVTDRLLPEAAAVDETPDGVPVAAGVLLDELELGTTFN